MKTTFYDSAMQELKSYVENRCGGNVTRAAEELGIKPVVLHQWIKGTRSPAFSGISVAVDAMGARFVPPDEELEAYDFVPKTTARAGAGSSFITEDETQGLYAFRKDFFAAQHISATKSILIDVMGDSMSPTLQDGDTILIDKSDTQIVDGRIYLVTLGDNLLIKRIFMAARGLVLHSDNPSYMDTPIGQEDLDAFRVHGRLRWAGKCF